MPVGANAVARWAAAHAATIPAGRQAAAPRGPSPPPEPVPAVLAAFTEVRTWTAGDAGLSIAWDQQPDDGLVLATGGMTEGELAIWDADTGGLIRDWYGPGEYVRSVRWGRGLDGRKVLGVAYADGTAVIVDAATEEILRELTDHTLVETSVAWGCRPGGRLLLATGESNDVVRIWDPDGDESSHSMYRWDFAWGNQSDGRPVLAVGDHRTVRIWDPRTQETLHTVPGHADEDDEDDEDYPEDTAWHFAWGRGPDGHPVLAIEEDGAPWSSGGPSLLWIWAWGGREPSALVLDPATGPIFAMSWAPPVNGRMLFAASTISTLRLWDGHTGKLLHSQRLDFQYAGDDHLDWTLTPDGRLLLAAADANAQLHIWEVVLEPPVTPSRGQGSARTRRPRAVLDRSEDVNPVVPEAGGSPGGPAIACPRGEELTEWLLRLGGAGLWAPLGVIADLVDLTGPDGPARLADLRAEEGMVRLRALGWGSAARVAFAALLASGLAIPDLYAPPSGVSADTLRAALARALATGSGHEEPSRTYPVPVRDLRAAAAAVTDRAVTLLRILGPAACAADPLLPVRLAHRIAQLPDLSPRELRLLTAAHSRRPADDQTRAAGTLRYTPGTVGLTRAGPLTRLLPTQLALPRDLMIMRLAENQLLYRQHRAPAPPTPQPVTIILDTTPPTFGPAGNTLRLAAHLITTTLWEHGRCPHMITLSDPGRAAELRSPADLVTLWTSSTFDQPAPALDAALAVAATIGEPVVFCTHHHTARSSYAVGRSTRLLSAHHPPERPPPRPASPWHCHLAPNPTQAELALVIGRLLTAQAGE